jgi:hypothetical protein
MSDINLPLIGYQGGIREHATKVTFMTEENEVGLWPTRRWKSPLTLATIVKHIDPVKNMNL